MGFGSRVSELLKNRGIKQNKFAEDIQEDPVSVNRYLKESRTPKVEFINKVVEYFPEVDLNWLFRGHGPSLDTLNEVPSAYEAPRTPQTLIENIEENLKELKAKLSQK